ncbi:MAG: hypothetical protein AAGF87_08635, partial [Bacteroidota bacterium]
LSDNRLETQLKGMAKKIGNIDFKIFYIAGYDHSRHMALFTDKNLSNVRSIYYYKKGYSNNVNAVFLRGASNRKNINMLFHTFKQYLAKSMLFKTAKINIGKSKLDFLPHFRDSKQIDSVIVHNENNILDSEDIDHFVKFDMDKILP